ncbi:hypothetical protein D3C71_936130 [compost metagenome]
MGQHRPTDHISDSINIGCSGLQLIIYHNCSPGIQLNIRIFQPQFFGISFATDSHQHIVSRYFLLLPRSIFERDLRAIAQIFCFINSLLKQYADPFLGQDFFEPIPQFMIHICQEMIRIFDDRNFNAQSIKYRGHFHANHTTTNYNHVFWLRL